MAKTKYELPKAIEAEPPVITKPRRTNYDPQYTTIGELIKYLEQLPKDLNVAVTNLEVYGDFKSYSFQVDQCTWEPCTKEEWWEDHCKY